MGCCSSTDSAYAPPDHRRKSDIRSDSPFHSSPFPPEQESVKEVLSETPVPKPQFPIRIEEAAENYNRVYWPEISEKVVDHSPVALEQVVVDEKSEMSTEERRQRSPAKLRNRSVSCQRRLIQTSPGRVDRQRRDSGEVSGRRSRSPATRVGDGGGGTNLGLSRNPSSRKTGKSPGRARSDPDKCRKEEDKSKWAPPVNESLENPLVSLECFIFL